MRTEKRSEVHFNLHLKKEKKKRRLKRIITLQI